MSGITKTNVIPDQESSIDFLSKIWGVSAEHKKDIEWLRTAKAEIKVEKQQDLVITVDNMKSGSANAPNWKSPGPDLVQGYWLKNFSSLHDRIPLQLNEFLKKRKCTVMDNTRKNYTNKEGR